MKATICSALILTGLTIGCRTAATGPAATVVLESRSGSTAAGTATLTERADGSVAVSLNITGATPGVHGIHIHEKGDCSAPDASSAGAHFNPTNAPHGAPGDASRHAGDFGNVTADEKGAIRSNILISGVTLGDGASSAVGKSLVLHASADDLKTQPSGNSGARIACGVVTLNGGVM